MLQVPERPAPPRSIIDRLRAWVEWVGVGRIAASAIAILVVLGGGFWLVRPPAATTESKLPYAGSATSVSVSTAPSGGVPVVAPLDVVIVHVAGAVNAPGVYQLTVGSRVIDAVAVAGGLAADANSDGLNLAALVVDGERVYVPRLGELTTVAATQTASEVWPININAADAARLEDLPGVGPATAALIVSYREQHGPFASVEQLAEVRGIGPAKLDAIRSLVTV